MERRVVITSCAAISPIGCTRNQMVKNLIDGVSGVRPMKDDALLTEHIHSAVFGTVDYPIEFNFKRRDRKTMGPVAFYACHVADETLKSSGLTDEFIRSGRLGFPTMIPVSSRPHRILTLWPDRRPGLKNSS